jgi:hypothetical protein
MAYDELTAKVVSENATLRAEVERLRAALKDIRDYSLELYATGVARTALAEEKPQ